MTKSPNETGQKTVDEKTTPKRGRPPRLAQAERIVSRPVWDGIEAMGLLAVEPTIRTAVYLDGTTIVIRQNTSGDPTGKGDNYIRLPIHGACALRDALSDTLEAELSGESAELPDGIGEPSAFANALRSIFESRRATSGEQAG